MVRQNVPQGQEKSMKYVASIASCLLFLALPAYADQALATAKSCMSCHQVDKKVVGPAYKNIAARYAQQRNAAINILAVKIIQGGAGAWGPVAMPANPQVNAAEAEKLARWIMSLQ